MMPILASDFITKPLMRQFMRNYILGKGSHRRTGLMLHTAAPSELRMSIFLFKKRILTESIRIDFDHEGGLIQYTLHRWKSFRINMMNNGHGINRAVFIIICIDGIVCNSKRKQVLGYRITVFPFKGFGSIAVIGYAHKFTIGCGI